MTQGRSERPTAWVRFAGCSFTGKRAENQDALLVHSPSDQEALIHKGMMACIADGVSCSQQGQQASHTATMQLITDYYATPKSWRVSHAVSQILNSMNRWLFQQGRDQLHHNGMVTTLSTVVVKSNTAYIFHVGDSRVYLYRDNTLTLLTRDHQRTSFGQQRYLTRALGMDEHVEIDVQTLLLQAGDRLLLSTDGVHDWLSQATLAAHFERQQPWLESSSDNQAVPPYQANPMLESWCQTLCQAALDAGSTDNVSCVLVSVDALPSLDVLEHQHVWLSQHIPPVLVEGQLLDQFQVIKPLYHGTRSHVYLAVDTETEIQYVLKMPSQHAMDDPVVLKQWANEAWIAAQFNHPRLMRMYPRPAASPFLYQVCEWIDGITLRQWMYDHPHPPLEQVREILADIVKGLRVLQRADMVHRDLKPENIMITTDQQMKLIDFGAVAVHGLLETQPEAFDDCPLGAVNYTAPEYMNTGQATIFSDLFSVGVIGYEMLTGALPYREASAQQIQQARHTKWHYRSLQHHRPDLPAWVDAVFQKVTAASPQQRYQALGDFVTDLYTPNPRLLKSMATRPLLTRHPLLFWKSMTVIMGAIALLALLQLWSVSS